ncbi:unnamed protein product [Peniophora sp. CBMAI 1063]|nr:unnamed protein product [Peniophora sp. CBMAI 1063]
MQASTTGAGAGGAGPASPEYASVRSSVQLSADLSNDLAFLESLRASVRANLIVRPLEGGRPLSFASESTTSPTDSMYFTPTSATFSTYSHASDTDREDDGEEESEREAEREKAEEYEPFMLSAQSIARGLYTIEVDRRGHPRKCVLHSCSFTTPNESDASWVATPSLASLLNSVGANVGLGLEAAKHLARMEPGKLVLACRSIKKAEDAGKEIQKETGFSRLGAYAVDLSVFSSVNAFIEEFESKEERLDILIYNAAIATGQYRATGDGFEETIQVNDLSCALVCVGLLPLLLKTSEATASASHRPRITVVSSAVHYWTKPTPEQLSSPNYLLKINDAEHCKEPGVMAVRYPVSKLLNVLFVRELAARVPHSKLIVNCLNPGYCYSALRRNMPFLASLRMSLMDFFIGNTTEQGGRRVAWTAVALRHCEERMHGAYTSYMEITEESDWAISEEGYATQKRLWNESVDVLAKVSPKFSQVIQTHLQ